MKLTAKDKDFLERLSAFCESKDLSIELENDGLSRFVLRQNYGDKIEQSFCMTRQGIRWRFQRLFNEIYISTYETLFFIENNFGTELRSIALMIAKERIALRKQAVKSGNMDIYRQKKPLK